MTHILGVSGSLRKGSFNTALLREAESLLEGGATFELAEIDSIPLFNEDLERDFPAVVTALKEKIQAADAIIISTPEYNRSIPGVLKNVLDWTSRPYGESAWKGKTVLVLGASAAPTGTAPGQAHLKNVLLYLDCHVLGQPEFYLASAYEKFDGEGKLTDESTKEHLKNALDALLSRIG